MSGAPAILVPLPLRSACEFPALHQRRGYSSGCAHARASGSSLPKTKCSFIISCYHWGLIKEALSNRARFWLACLTRMSTQNYHSKVTWFYWVRRQEGWVASGIEAVLTSHTIWPVGSAHRRKWGGWNACWIEVEQSLPHQKLRSPRHHWKK